jgi:hypothetical protein
MVRPSAPVIVVSIGQQTRVYHAFVTTAPPALDGPSTVTLYAASFGEVVGLAANSKATDETRAAVKTRLVLIDGRELNWHRERYRAADHYLSPADPALVGLKTLQHRLWQRLQARPQGPDTMRVQE